MKDYTKEFHRLLEIVQREHASDLHLSANKNPIIRVGGELIHLSNEAVLTNDDVEGFLAALTTPDKLEDFHQTYEIDFAFHGENNMRLRGNAFRHSNSTGIALRVIETVRTLSELGLPPILETFTTKKQGFFLVVGPVGQGKSTTLAAMIELINENRKEHIVTIENPVEYLFEEKMSLINQREIGQDSKDFDTALKFVFRQDVNVIMIGEMRSPETMAAAVTAAETGHLVFSTLHTNDAAQTIDRIIDSFPPIQQDQIRTQLAGSLLGVFSQRLIPRIGGGRVPAYELLLWNHAVANLIREARTHELESVIETGHEYGMISMNRSLVDLVQAGLITIDNAKRYSLNPKGLDRML